MRLVSLAVPILILLGACAHLPVEKGEKPDALLADACRPGSTILSLKGSIWMKLDSKEAKGQFPADVSAHVPDQVTLEVTNLIGSREALILVNQGKYSVEVPSKDGGPSRKSGGQGSWGGIPLQWASDLFLGRIPCPKASAATLKINVGENGDLVAEGGGERFVYHFRSWAGRAWPESLHWENLAQPGLSVDFKFDDPEDKTGAPKKWEAKSSRGEVKVRWKDLQTAS